MSRFLWVVVVLSSSSLAFLGCGEARVDSAPPEKLTIRLKSSVFNDQGQIPKLYTCDGEDISPPLAWAGVPADAKSLVLICEDPDAPLGTWCHWLLFDLPPDVRELRPNLTKEAKIDLAGAGKFARQGTNDFGKAGYGGPCPPGGTHRYVFRIHALDESPKIKDGAKRGDVLKAIQGHVIASGKIVGKYGR